jgi:hypothetical protein
VKGYRGRAKRHPCNSTSRQDDPPYGNDPGNGLSGELDDGLVYDDDQLFDPNFMGHQEWPYGNHSRATGAQGGRGFRKRAEGGPGAQDVFIVALADGYDINIHLRWLSGELFSRNALTRAISSAVLAASPEGIH